MKSRIHPKYKTKYRVTNWPQYDQALVKRGDITLWISPEAINAWNAKPSGRRGAPQKYTDLAIETALTLRLVFRLPLRQAVVQPEVCNFKNASAAPNCGPALPARSVRPGVVE